MPVLHVFLNSSSIMSVTRLIRSGDLDTIKLLLREPPEFRANRQASAAADDPIVEPVEPGSPLGDDLRLEALLRTRGTAISIAPSSPITVLLEYPLRLLPPRPAGSPFKPRCSPQFGAERTLQQALFFEFP